MKMYMLNTPQGFKPCTDEDAEKKKKFKLGEVYSFEVKRPRNYEFHKKFFALLNLVWENLPETISNDYGRFENFRYDLTMRCGFREKYTTPRGAPYWRAKSISFGSMTAEEFETLYNKAIDVIMELYLPGIEKEDLENEVLAFT